MEPARQGWNGTSLGGAIVRRVDSMPEALASGQSVGQAMAAEDGDREPIHLAERDREREREGGREKESDRSIGEGE